jgi:ankyrin repeat protein
MNQELLVNYPCYLNDREIYEAAAVGNMTHVASSKHPSCNRHNSDDEFLSQVELALQSGQYVDKESPQDGWSALHWACFNGDVAMCNRLLEKGASIHHLDRSGCSPLDKAVLRGMKGAAQVLVSRGATLSSAAVK